MKTKKFALTVLTFIFIGLFNSYGHSPFFNGEQLYEHDITLTINGVDISHADYGEAPYEYNPYNYDRPCGDAHGVNAPIYGYYMVQFSEPVTFDSCKVKRHYNDDDELPSIASVVVYTTDGNTVNVQKFDVANSNVFTDIPDHIIGLSIVEQYGNMFRFKGIQPSPIQNDTVEVVEHDTVYQTVHDTVVQYDTINTTDTVTYFVDTCNTSTNIKSHKVTDDYDVYISPADNLSIEGGTVERITIYNATGQKIKVQDNQNYMYVGDLKQNVQYIALIELANGDTITYKFANP